MNLHATILGLLNWRPCSGYDLKRILSDSDLFYWSGNNNQIYKILLELQQAGQVTFEEQRQTSLPTRKIYSVTDAGRDALEQALLQQPEAPELHRNFLIQLAWAESLSDDELLNLLKKYEEEITSCLRLAEGQQQRKKDHPGRSARERYLWSRLDENMVQAWRAELAWTRETARGIRENDMQGGRLSAPHH
jgi:PadR family transcriptional regulator, regulatory protein AphA